MQPSHCIPSFVNPFSISFVLLANATPQRIEKDLPILFCHSLYCEKLWQTGRKTDRKRDRLAMKLIRINYMPCQISQQWQMAKGAKEAKRTKPSGHGNGMQCKRMQSKIRKKDAILLCAIIIFIIGKYLANFH